MQQTWIKLRSAVQNVLCEKKKSNFSWFRLSSHLKQVKNNDTSEYKCTEIKKNRAFWITFSVLFAVEFAMPGLSFTFVSFLISDSRFPRYVCPCSYVLLRCLFRRTSGRARAMDGFNFHRFPSGTRSYGVSVYRTSTRVSYGYISIDQLTRCG